MFVVINLSATVGTDLAFTGSLVMHTPRSFCASIVDCSVSHVMGIGVLDILSHTM